jgi:ABC-type nitrate/sulfonate/bicarbonate transport system permease component
MADEGIALGTAVADAAADARRDTGSRIGWLKHPLVLRLISVAVVLGAWEYAGRVPISLAFPTCLETITALARMIADGSLLKAYASTLQPLVIGIVISGLLGVALGVAMGLYRGLEWLGAPVFIVMQAAPVAALIPVITYIYGIGLASKVLAVCILAMPVIVLNAFTAVRNASPSLIQMCRSFQGTRMQEIWKVIIPDASPIIFAGLRLGVAAGFIGVVLAELLITPTGIGDLITYHRSIADYPEMYAAILSIILFAVITVSTLERLEVTLFRPEKRAR